MTQILDFNKLLPAYLKNEVLSSLVSNLFNRFVSEERSVLVAGTIGTPVAGQAIIQEPTLERQENALIPGLFYAAGTEQFLFTFDDFINKINTLNIDINDLRAWIAEQTFNYAPPINYDKFINFTNYFWVGTSLPAGSGPAWNPNNLPEYYVIARPAPTDSIKMPVRLATTASFGNINLFFNDRPPETFTLTFTDAIHFTVTSNLDANVLFGPFALNFGTGTPTNPQAGVTTSFTIQTSDAGVAAPSLNDGAQIVPLATFTVTTGISNFAAGDSFTLFIEYFTSNTLATLNSISQIGKGTITGINSIFGPGQTPQAMFIDGISIKVGDRILVKDQLNTVDNGIYIAVAGGKWQRSTDLSVGQTYTNITIFVESGATQSGTTWIFTSGIPQIIGTTNLTFVRDLANPPTPVNDWQTNNFWIHENDIPLFTDLGFTINNSTQAQRPIIEYLDTLQLNSYVDGDGNPSNATTNGVANIFQPQVKTRFGQIPQFDLLRYDGTHSGSTSGIWFYAESPNYVTDNILQRRVVTTVNGDYVFGSGIADAAGRLLYWVNDGQLNSIWQPGVTAAKASTPIFVGGSGKGKLFVTSVSMTADNQQWTATATSQTTFSIVGTRSGDVGTATALSAFTTDDLTLFIDLGINPFVVGEKFTWNVYAPTSPRYVEQLPDGSIVNFPGGYAADHANPVPVGAWLTPSRMFQNLNRQTAQQIAHGDFFNHAVSTIAWQDGFIGSAFGVSNVRNLNFNSGLGGQIREFSSNFPLLASMLIEQNISPITIIDFAEQQYNTALASIDQFLINNLAIYFASVGAIETTSINPSAPDIQALEAYFEKLRSEDVNLTSVFSDSTAAVVNWPATLPYLGLLPKVVPGVQFDFELNSAVIVYHDGHTAVVASDDPDFDRTLVKTIVPRSDGTKTPGIFSEAQPPSPYARQLWMKPSTFTISLFDVDFDTVVMPQNGSTGQYWYQRSTNTLFVFSGGWIPALVTIASRWISVNTSAIRNSLVLAVENKLYNGIHPQQQLNLNLLTSNIINSPYAQLELAQFSAEFNLDTFAPDYNPGNAFTWNYKQATIPSVATPTPARWFNIYSKYFGSFGAGVVSTERPDIQPWRLLGFTDEPATWAATWAAPVFPVGGPTTTVNRLTTSNTALSGLQVVDGSPVSSGDRILVIGQVAQQNNGIYIAAAGAWTRSSDVITSTMNVTVLDGFAWANTNWTLSTANPITVGTTNLTFKQVRVWKPEMWAAISGALPSLKLCVNTNTDGLIPPYVSPTQFASSQALLTVIPQGVNLGYAFGDDGPVELVWKKSLEFNYGLARSYFRLFPLQFLDAAWGETYIRSGSNLRVERNLEASLPSSKFLLHGERLNLINNWTPAQAKQRFVNLTNGVTWSQTFSGTVSFTVTHIANTGAVGPLGSMGPSSTVFYVFVNGVKIGLIYEGVPFSFSSDGVTFSNVTIDDLGIPFEMGDTLVVTFPGDTITTNNFVTNQDFIFGILGCEGCVNEATPNSTSTVTITVNQPTYSFNPGQTKIFNGVGQWFTDLLRFNFIDTDISTSALAYRGWTLNLVHRLGALVRPDSIDINTSQGDMPTTAYNVMLKRSMNTSDLWITGLRVQLVQMGARTLTQSGLWIPVGAGDDWIFRISGYNNAHPQLNYFQLATNLGAPFQDFIALGGAHTKLQWNQFTEVVSTQTTMLPLQITGIQNVLNFIYGYVGLIQNQGFKINATDTPITDQETGRNLDWQLEIEKFIDTVYSGQQAGQAYSLNPFMNALFLQTPTGLMGRYSTSAFIDVASTQAAYDVAGNAIPINNLRIIRTDDQTVTHTTTPIFSAHVFIDQFEHAIIFNNNFTSDVTSPLIFNPFLGEFLSSAYLTVTRQDVADGKPTFDGFYLKGNTVARNITSSVAQISNFYDAGQTFNDPVTAKNATALLGFQLQPYFNNLNISPTTQLDFWRGLIHAKGTNFAVEAFTNYKAFLDASIDEFWAYKLSTYGDARENTSPEIKINPADTAQTYTQLQFFSASDPNYSTVGALPLYIQVEADDTTRFEFNDLGTILRFDSQSIAETFTITAGPFPQYVTLQNIYYNEPSAYAPTIGASTFLPTPDLPVMITANIAKVFAPATYTVNGFTWLNKTKFSPIQLYDYVNNVRIRDITLWHPAIGIHAFNALETINMITDHDPAHYNTTTNTTDNPNYLALKPWADREVGRVWWDTKNLDYVPYYDASIFPDRQTRQTRWGSLADYAKVNLYVWTKSPFPPAEYNAQAALQAGNASIDPAVRLSGTVGFTNFYSSQRVITITPIAWSEAGVGNGNAHPAFGPAFFTKLYISGTNLIADTGRLADINVVAGRSLGAWNMLPMNLGGQVPASEVLIGSTVGYDIGSALDGPGVPILTPATGVLASVTVNSIGNSSIFGTQIGQLKLVDNNDGTTFFLRMMSSSGFTQDVQLSDWTSTNLLANSQQTYTFDQFGLQVTATRSATGTITASNLAIALTNPSNDIFVREQVSYTVVVPFPSNTGTTLDNNPADVPASEFGWKTWMIPTQAQLSSDLIPPNNQWLPYLGQPVTIQATGPVAAAMADPANTLTLSTGIVINRFNSSWTPFVQLEDEVQITVSNGSAPVVFTLADQTSISSNRLSVYANGIQLNPSAYVINGNLVQIVNILPEGTTVRLLYRMFQPTAADLAFNPAVKDNPIIQTQYKQDYQFTKLVQRNSLGAITGTNYYFWVTGKTDPLPNQSFNLVQASEDLTKGEDTYMLFSRLVADGNSVSGSGFDSCAIFGLGTLVNAVNTFKLRFLRDFTLRDDPEQLKLKNVHTEWTLIRQNQSTRIPQQLWNVLTNAACGQDAGGNQLPSQIRIDYDNLYGTQTQFGFGNGQIFAPMSLTLGSIINTILNTKVTVTVGNSVITDDITVLNITPETTQASLTAQSFSSPAVTRTTMNLIYNTARAAQINEIFFNALNDALVSNYQLTDIFKTSLLTLSSATNVTQQTQSTQINEFY